MIVQTQGSIWINADRMMKVYKLRGGTFVRPEDLAALMVCPERYLRNRRDVITVPLSEEEKYALFQLSGAAQPDKDLFTVEAAVKLLKQRKKKGSATLAKRLAKAAFGEQAAEKISVKPKAKTEQKQKASPEDKSTLKQHSAALPAQAWAGVLQLNGVNLADYRAMLREEGLLIGARAAANVLEGAGYSAEKKAQARYALVACVEKLTGIPFVGLRKPIDKVLMSPMDLCEKHHISRPFFTKVINWVNEQQSIDLRKNERFSVQVTRTAANHEVPRDVASYKLNAEGILIFEKALLDFKVAQAKITKPIKPKNSIRRSIEKTAAKAVTNGVQY